MKTKLIMLTVCLVLINGCVTQLDPKTELLFAQKTFLGTINSLTILREADKFSDGEVANIKTLINSGDRILDKWTDAVLEGKDSPSLADAFNAVLTELINYRERGENNG